MMRPDRADHYAQFIAEYEAVRAAEGRGSEEPSYYRSLPFADRSGLFTRDWNIRAKSFANFLTDVVEPAEGTCNRPLAILDLGAGNGWLSYQMAKRGHVAAAVDLLVNRLDGLGAQIYYDKPFTSVQAEFDWLPFRDKEFDIAVFNASFHYSADYEATLCEAWRVVKPNGRVVVLDSPLYSSASSGRDMMVERERYFTGKFGFASNSIASEGFLTPRRLTELSRSTRTDWRLVDPAQSSVSRIRHVAARLCRRREAARFIVIVGTRATLALPATEKSQTSLSLYRRQARTRGIEQAHPIRNLCGRKAHVIMTATRRREFRSSGGACARLASSWFLSSSPSYP
jgi:SAM-dependent methyltransferase